MDYESHLKEVLQSKENLKLVRKEAEEYCEKHNVDECSEMGKRLYLSESYQIQEVGVFILGHIAAGCSAALDFLRHTVSENSSWKVQETLAMAFDIFCHDTGYEKALPVIRDWLKDENANVRRAASEGLRVWTSRPYFREHPEEAIAILSSNRDDPSEYCRKSIGNALKDISRKFPELVAEEIATWNLQSKEEKQVYKIASKYLHARTSL